MTLPPRERRRRPPRRRPGTGLRVLLGIVAAAALFAIGVAVGEALHDNPQPGLTTTQITTVHP